MRELNNGAREKKWNRKPTGMFPEGFTDVDLEGRKETDNTQRGVDRGGSTYGQRDA